MDKEKSFDEKLKKRIEKDNTVLPQVLNEKINDTLHNLPVKRKSYRVHMMFISAAVLTLSIVSMSEFSIQSFAQNGGMFNYVKKNAFSDYENEEEIKSNVNYPDKEKIHQKMLDSIDHFKMFQGNSKNILALQELLQHINMRLIRRNKVVFHLKKTSYRKKHDDL